MIKRPFCNKFDTDQNIRRGFAVCRNSKRAPHLLIAIIVLLISFALSVITVEIMRGFLSQSIGLGLSALFAIAGLITTSLILTRWLAEFKRVEGRLATQIERLMLLDNITRTVNQQSEMAAVFRFAVQAVEEKLPADFVCVCRHDEVAKTLNVTFAGVQKPQLAEQLGLGKDDLISTEQQHLQCCVSSNELVYEADLSDIEPLFMRALQEHGMRSLILSPLSIEGQVLGVLVVAREQPHGFPPTDRDFLRQLGGHVAVAAHQAKLRMNLRKAYDDLQSTQRAVVERERLSAIGQMASGIAHDINNAISPVGIYTQCWIDRGDELSAEMRDYLAIVGRVVEDVGATIARLRDVYRPGAGKSASEPIDLNLIISQTVELTRARWSDMPHRRGITINVVTALEADMPRVIANSAEMRDAVTNLIFNAVDAMPDGGTISITTERLVVGEGGKALVRFEVGDDGPGMDASTRSRCLEPFFTTKGERGTGLGLAMVHAAVQRHGASLDIDSAPGAGTRVRILFPAEDDVSLAETVDASIEAPRDLRLLVVDDDRAVLRSTAYVLELSGHMVCVAEGGQAALDTLHISGELGDRFDAVITDLGMPSVDGAHVAAAVKANAPETKVVLLTGWGDSVAGDADALPNVDFVLTKPVQIPALRAALAQI
ncbi:ATP-binding protein [Sphingomonas crocodyli]|uniref:histidine kinase n=1 Tax=Sphingomonas crocodyli TaxID=1979270 RepID=A0A437M886_9SPHN|nr:ATP-binding protein [Sphingomonas crocodyli]RVT93922.1 hybrid sensor histidine kinase/response regulator [Sphingomonas crocodyli]